MKKQEIPQKPEFDHVVHVQDEEGKSKAVNPYSLTVCSEGSFYFRGGKFFDGSAKEIPFDLVPIHIIRGYKLEKEHAVAVVRARRRIEQEQKAALEQEELLKKQAEALLAEAEAQVDQEEGVGSQAPAEHSDLDDLDVASLDAKAPHADPHKGNQKHKGKHRA